jgi:hypothetical protein
MYKILLVSTFVFAVSCSNENAQSLKPQALSDSFLFAELNSSGYRYYKSDSLPKDSAPGSGHIGQVLVRFNPIAQRSLDSTGKLPVSDRFSEGSMIVKELYSTGVLANYAIMYKSATDPTAGGGWVWGYMNLQGSITFRADKGQGCIGCHSIEGNRDLVRTFALR